MVLLDIPWDKGDPRSERPAWDTGSVARLLDGVGCARESRLVLSLHDGVHRQCIDLDFECGCQAIGDRGWKPCGDALHAELSESSPGSALVTTYERLRAVFTGVLAAAWEINGHVWGAENLRATGVAPEQFRRTRGLGCAPIWRFSHRHGESGLSADLEMRPMERRIQLYNAGNSARVDLILELILTGAPMEAGDAEDDTTFDVSNETVAQIMRRAFPSRPE